MGLPDATEPFPVAELSERGLLWLINRVVFHPRGFALAMLPNGDGTVTHMQLLGDGLEPIYFELDENRYFQAAERVLNVDARHTKIRALHQLVMRGIGPPFRGECLTCRGDYPCATILALDGTDDG